MPNHYTEQLLCRWIVLRIVIWQFFLEICTKVKNFLRLSHLQQVRGFHSAAFAFAVSTCSRWFEHDSLLFVRGSRNARRQFINYLSTFLVFFEPPPPPHARKHIFSTEIKPKLPSLLLPNTSVYVIYECSLAYCGRIAFDRYLKRVRESEFPKIRKFQKEILVRNFLRYDVDCIFSSFQVSQNFKNHKQCGQTDP